jgi:O-antigen ligase
MNRATELRTPSWVLEARTGRASGPGRQVLRRLSLGFLIVALLGSPIPFGSVEPWSQGVLATVVVAAVLCWGCGCVHRRSLTVSVHPVHWALLCFLLLGLIQYFTRTTTDPVGTRDALLALLPPSLVFLLSGQLLVDCSGLIWRRLGQWVTIYLLLIALLGILQWLSSGRAVLWPVPAATGFGPYVNRDHYAGLMEMVIPLAGCFLLAGRGTGSLRVTAGIAVLLGIASTLLSGSRTGMLALMFEVIVLLIVLAGQPAARRRRQAASVGAGIALSALLFFWIDPGGISRRLAETFRPNRSSDFTVEFATRKQAALDCLRILGAHPWLGSGLGSFVTDFPQYKSFADDFRWDHAQNDYAEALAETGIVGGLLIVAFVGLFIRAAFANLRPRLATQAGWIQFGAALGCCGLLIHSFADFNLHIPANATWFAFCAACASLKGSPSPGRRCGVHSPWPSKPD